MAVLLLAVRLASNALYDQYFRIQQSDVAIHIKGEAQMTQQHVMQTESLEVDRNSIQLELSEKLPI